jgi:hypothetical protein
MTFGQDVWHHGVMDPSDLEAIRDRYDQAINDAERRREHDIRDALAAGVKQAALVAATGWTRETLRQLASPDIREKARQAAVDRRAAQKAQRQRADTA